MCGRVRLSSDVSEIKLVFSIPPHRPTPNIARRAGTSRQPTLSRWSWGHRSGRNGGGDDLLACDHPVRQRQNNGASLIEPVVA